MNDFLNSFSDIPANIMANLSQVHFTLDLIIKLVLAYFIVIWCAFIIWTVKDITARSGNILVQVFCILVVIVLTPILGLPIYLLIRPANKYQTETMESVQDAFSCPKCGGEVEEDFFFCPHCKHELLFKCQKCGKLCESTWHACPYCGTEKTIQEEIKTVVKKQIAVEEVSEKEQEIPKNTKTEDEEKAEIPEMEPTENTIPEILKDK